MGHVSLAVVDVCRISAYLTQQFTDASGDTHITADTQLENLDGTNVAANEQVHTLYLQEVNHNPLISDITPSTCRFVS